MKVLLLVAFGALVALQGSSAGSSVIVELGNNEQSFAIIPNEVDSLVVTSQYRLINISRLTNSIMPGLETVQQNCDDQNCTITLVYDNSTVDIINLEFEFSAISEEPLAQSLSLTIRRSLNVACAKYNIPVEFASNTTYSFVCEPVSSNDGVNISGVIWHRFRNYTALQEFQSLGSEVNSSRIETDGIFVLGGTMNNTLTVRANIKAIAEDIAYYFVPSFKLEGNDTEIATAETYIYVKPAVTTSRPEFSIDLLLNTALYDRIRCETTSFPAATVSWTLVSEDFPGDGENVANINTSRFSLTDSGTYQDLTRSINAIVVMRNLQYEDDGNFSCIASNMFGSSPQWFRLRVKSPLRPLWPALGIIGALSLTAFFMSGGYLVDRIVQRQREKRESMEPKSENDTNSSSRSGAEKDYNLHSLSTSGANASNSKDTGHTSVKRLSSTKPLLEETTFQ